MNVENTDFFDTNAKFMSLEERDHLSRVGMGKRMGFGDRPALLIVDAQRFEFGALEPGDNQEYPVACPTAKDSIPIVANIIDAFRRTRRPIFYARMVYRRDGRNYANRHLKRPLRDTEGWCLEGSVGSEIIDQLAPLPTEAVIEKSRPSFFHGTSLLHQLISLSVDTTVIVGGTTSNCIRATAIDSAAWSFRTMVVRDAVFDRVQISHHVSLMDIDRQLGDVVSSEEVVSYLGGLPAVPD